MGAGASEPRRRRKRTKAIAARAITITPPTTPPTMAPMFELLFGVDEEVGFTVEEDSPKSDDVVPLRVPEAETVAPETETAAPEGPSIAPGAFSGESPTEKDLFAFQLFSDVISMRAH